MIKVIDPGFYSSIQDLGRFGTQNFGVPISGSMDQFSADIANKIIGNDSSEALIELTMKGCSLKFKNHTVIAITGSDMSPKLNGLSIGMYSVIEVKCGGTQKAILQGLLYTEVINNQWPHSTHSI